MLGRRVGPPAVTDVDYLLGVSDLTRQGALRFSLPAADRDFLGADLEVPKLVDLPRLLHAADEVASDADDAESSAAVKLLLDAGSASLGGARPKASVRDGNRLLIAKFPHPADGWDVMAWEKTALDLAERAGIPVPSRRLERVGGRHVLLLVATPSRTSDFDTQGGDGKVHVILAGTARSPARPSLELS